ncbi:hypothetical protein DPMN_168267 [Dreissena polymorpha]|uniref:Uncharacterized protein n=1 Tax=Dreissena polymorpha TaxID=45954 RepID=A0A9D4IZE9_DREPO|nr:hypothetical protein DPMN_168267 [Dreissena polymorpha]
MPRPLEVVLTINVASKVLTRKKCPAPWWPYIIGTNLLTKFHKDQTINVASRMLTRKNALPPGSHVFQPISIIFKNSKNALPLGSHVFQANITIFKLIQDIIETNLLTKFHEDWTMRPLEYHWKNVLTKFHENLTINVASRENAPPHKCHVFQPTGVILKLVKDIIGLNLK